MKYLILLVLLNGCTIQLVDDRDELSRYLTISEDINRACLKQCPGQAVDTYRVNTKLQKLICTCVDIEIVKKPSKKPENNIVPEEIGATPAKAEK